EAARRASAQAEMETRREAVETLSRELEGAERERQWAHREAEERRQELHALEREHEALGRAAAEAERELSEFQTQLEAARLRVVDADGELHALEARRDQAAATAQAARDALLAMSREAGEIESRWAREEQTRHELETNLAQRREEVTQSKARVAEIH